MEEYRNASKILTGKSVGNRPVRRSTCRWQDNIKIHLKEIGVDVTS